MKLCFHFTKNKIVKLKTNVKSMKKGNFQNHCEEKIRKKCREENSRKITGKNSGKNSRGESKKTAG